MSTNLNSTPGQPDDGNEPLTYALDWDGYLGMSDLATNGDILDAIDETAASISDDCIEKRLRHTLRSAGYSPRGSAAPEGDPGCTFPDAAATAEYITRVLTWPAHNRPGGPMLAGRWEYGRDDLRAAREEAARILGEARDEADRAVSEAVRIVENAKEQAEQIISDARREAEQIRNATRLPAAPRTTMGYENLAVRLTALPDPMRREAINALAHDLVRRLQSDVGRRASAVTWEAMADCRRVVPTEREAAAAILWAVHELGREDGGHYANPNPGYRGPTAIPPGLQHPYPADLPNRSGSPYNPGSPFSQGPRPSGPPSPSY